MIKPATVIARVVAAAWLGIIVKLTMMPIPAGADLARRKALIDPSVTVLDTAQLVPFRTVHGSVGIDFVRQILGNAVLVAPLGFLLPFAFRRLENRKPAMVVAALVGSSVEIAQLLVSLAIGVPYRLFDVDDLWLNSLGAAIGGLVGAAVAKRHRG